MGKKQHPIRVIAPINYTNKCPIEKIVQTYSPGYYSLGRNIFVDRCTPITPSPVLSRNVIYTIIAHPGASMKGIRISGDRKCNEILAAWWVNSKLVNCKTLYAHVCKGNNVYSRPIYQKIFNNIISYDTDIQIFVGDSGSYINQVWESVFLEIESYLDSSPQNPVSGIKNIFRRKMKLIEKTNSNKRFERHLLMSLSSCYNNIS